ncbi:MAG TPA: hypothetical protein VMI12_15185 [Puia sp.]|nr:hypothetical protein [Puia sp.]
MSFSSASKCASSVFFLVFIFSASVASPSNQKSWYYKPSIADTIPSEKKHFSESDCEMDQLARELESIDWKEIRKQIDQSLESIDFKKIKEETKKAMQQANENIDFKKMQEMIQRSLNEAKKSIREMNQFSAINPEYISKELRKTGKNQTHMKGITKAGLTSI